MAPNLRPLAPAELAAWHSAFAAARPFPHVVLDDWLSEPGAAAAAFPAPGWAGWTRYEGNEYQREKRIANDLGAMPLELAALIHEFHSPRVLAALEQITGIRRLIPDPYLNGGGLHCSPEGGVLVPHTDFHHYERLGLYRRLNVLVYLNRSWTPGDGGELELFGDAFARTAPTTVEPLLGRVVVFRTDHQSVHGFTVPVAPGRVRNSVALYYYTAAEAPTYSGDTTTYWRRDAARNRPPTWTQRVRLRVYRSLLFGARAIAWCAHRANPSRMSDPMKAHVDHE